MSRKLDYKIRIVLSDKDIPVLAEELQGEPKGRLSGICHRIGAGTVRLFSGARKKPERKQI